MHKFISSVTPPGKKNQNSFWFIFFNDQIVLRSDDEKHEIPMYKDYLNYENLVKEKYYMGSYDGIDCYTVLLSETAEIEGYEIIRLRKSYYTIQEVEFFLAGKAYQTLHFHHRHLFCGTCGEKTEIKQEEFARICPECKTTFYPQQAPAVIMSVTKENKILLARATRFPGMMYSVLAGFVEPGESLEDCVRREVREECSIEVKNIKYFGSQPWPFPNSLMVGFTAEYDSGEIIIDENEIIDAGWYAVDNLPLIPDHVSIARKLIDDFVERQK
jgi:NAD+ diphosphatase